MNHKKSVALIVLLTCLLLLVGCQETELLPSKEPSTQELIIGEWEESSDPDLRVLFKEDGTIVSRSVSIGTTYEGTYEIINDNQVTIQIANDAVTFRIMSISKDACVLKRETNGEDILTLLKVGTPVEPASGAPIAPSGPPQAAIDVAIDRTKKAILCGEYGEAECKDFNVACSEKLELTAADKANGIEEKWCLGLTYIYKRDLPEWADDDISVLVQKKGGVWEIDALWCEECR